MLTVFDLAHIKKIKCTLDNCEIIYNYYFQVAEEEAVKEEATPEIESAVEVPKAVEEPAIVVEEKESLKELNVNTQ